MAWSLLMDWTYHQPSSTSPTLVQAERTPINVASLPHVAFVQTAEKPPAHACARHKIIVDHETTSHIGNVVKCLTCILQTSRLWIHVNKDIPNKHIFLVEVGLRAQNTIWNFRVPCGINSNTFKVKIYFSCCLSFTTLELFCHNYMKNP
jgi:hypothetical protein